MRSWPIKRIGQINKVFGLDPNTPYSDIVTAVENGDVAGGLSSIIAKAANKSYTDTSFTIKFNANANRVMDVLKKNAQAGEGVYKNFSMAKLLIIANDPDRMSKTMSLLWTVATSKKRLGSLDNAKFIITVTSGLLEGIVLNFDALSEILEGEQVNVDDIYERASAKLAGNLEQSDLEREQLAGLYSIMDRGSTLSKRHRTCKIIATLLGIVNCGLGDITEVTPILDDLDMLLTAIGNG